MRAGAEECPLRDADGIFDRDGREGENEGLLADPNMRADLKAPGKRDIHPAADDDAVANARAEEAEEKDAQGRWPRKCALKEEAFGQDPKSFFQHGGAAVEPRGAVSGKIAWICLRVRHSSAPLYRANGMHCNLGRARGLLIVAV
jgi:hypothetical protein